MWKFKRWYFPCPLLINSVATNQNNYICLYPAVSGGASPGPTLVVLDDPGTGEAQINHRREII
jgi:hypothetical protein